jgi:hypothetical protein
MSYFFLLQWFSPGTPVSSTNNTDRHDIAEILLKVTLNTITLTQNQKELIVKKDQINTPSTTPHLSEIRTHNISGDRL